jgi:hypothetical protein
VRVASWLYTKSIAQVCFARVRRLSIVLQTAPDTFLRDYPLKNSHFALFERWLIKDIGLICNNLVGLSFRQGERNTVTMSASVGVRNQ